MSDVWLNVQDNHFKIWGCDLFKGEKESRVITYWGKIGLTMDCMQKKEKTFEQYIFSKNDLLAPLLDTTIQPKSAVSALNVCLNESNVGNIPA